MRPYATSGGDTVTNMTGLQPSLIVISHNLLLNEVVYRNASCDRLLVLINESEDCPIFVFVLLVEQHPEMIIHTSPLSFERYANRQCDVRFLPGGLSKIFFTEIRPIFSNSSCFFPNHSGEFEAKSPKIIYMRQSRKDFARTASVNYSQWNVSNEMTRKKNTHTESLNYRNAGRNKEAPQQFEFLSFLPLDFKITPKESVVTINGRKCSYSTIPRYQQIENRIVSFYLTFTMSEIHFYVEYQNQVHNQLLTSSFHANNAIEKQPCDQHTVANVSDTQKNTIEYIKKEFCQQKHLQPEAIEKLKDENIPLCRRSRCSYDKPLVERSPPPLRDQYVKHKGSIRVVVYSAFKNTGGKLKCGKMEEKIFGSVEDTNISDIEHYPITGTSTVYKSPAINLHLAASYTGKVDTKTAPVS
ncbi:hypothetical protein DICVIV_07199 [Dictyocaulus viviparus]|uniref:Uncharacterized protein n=1 Tax=Dictyocaulus viviparus TaxID=29172 RepID=A0A0D8XWM6_DICVI|nr:hypothetical protein DICVIV_07199 [Dictyocaulus viviparus]